MKFNLRKEDGKWLVYGMVIPFGDSTMNIDFENPQEMLDNMMEEMTQDMTLEFQNGF
ncbi:MAG: hypothetical protein VCB26_02695 [Candidatus Hydrogenedentota bacterium]